MERNISLTDTKNEREPASKELSGGQVEVPGANHCGESLYQKVNISTHTHHLKTSHYNLLLIKKLLSNSPTNGKKTCISFSGKSSQSVLRLFNLSLHKLIGTVYHDYKYTKTYSNH